MLFVKSTLAGQGFAIQWEKKDVAKQVHGVMALAMVKFGFGWVKGFEPVG